MLTKKASSYKSLLSVSLLAVGVGLSSTACRATEATTNLVEATVSTPVEAIASQENSNTAPTTEADSEIDYGDAYVRNDPNPVPITAEAAGKESEPLKEADYVAPPVDDSYIAGEEQSEFFYTGTPVVNIPVPEVRASLAQGMPYAAARAMLVTNGWEPIADTTVDTTYDASLRNMHEIGYVEAEACSGTGLGFCSMGFAGRDGVVLSITLTTSSEVPTVQNWSVNTL
ncbi:MAG: hypothetical protein AAF635_11780 [Cyanobacteria bacterium P01_C01_bin.69]